MGHETVEFYSWQGTLQDKVDGGQRVACCMEMIFQQLPDREGRRSHHSPACHVEVNNDAKQRHQQKSGVISQQHNTLLAQDWCNFVLWHLCQMLQQ